MEIEIQGHTDSIASEKYNQWLSEKRANSAKEYFVSKDVNEKRITTRGFGETRPIVSNDTPEGRAKNRRIEIMVTNK
jgi:OOP family OmpA-OmpF porin